MGGGGQNSNTNGVYGGRIIQSESCLFSRVVEKNAFIGKFPSDIRYKNGAVQSRVIKPAAQRRALGELLWLQQHQKEQQQQVSQIGTTTTNQIIIIVGAPGTVLEYYDEALSLPPSYVPQNKAHIWTTCVLVKSGTCKGASIGLTKQRNEKIKKLDDMGDFCDTSSYLIHYQNEWKAIAKLCCHEQPEQYVKWCSMIDSGEYYGVVLQQTEDRYRREMGGIGTRSCGMRCFCTCPDSIWRGSFNKTSCKHCNASKLHMGKMDLESVTKSFQSYYSKKISSNVKWN
jgi:hypothetical protein